MREYLRRLREEKSLTQAEVARRLDISESHYNLIENGKRQKNISVTLLKKLSNIFSVSLDFLVAEEEKLIKE